MSLQTWLANREDRCPAGFHAIQHPSLCHCQDVTPIAPRSEWAIFVQAVKAVAAENDGIVYQSDRPDGRLGVRRRIRGRIEPKHIGQLWRRARTEGLVSDTGEREPSNDTAGRNADKLDRIYSLRSAA